MQGLLAATLSHISYSHRPGLQEKMSCQQLTGYTWQQELYCFVRVTLSCGLLHSCHSLPCDA